MVVEQLSERKLEPGQRELHVSPIEAGIRSIVSREMSGANLGSFEPKEIE